MPAKTLHNIPSFRASVVRLGDFVELQSLRRDARQYSIEDLIADFRRACSENPSDSDDFPDDEDEDTPFEKAAEETFQELSERLDQLGDAARFYPFDLIGKELLRVKEGVAASEYNLLYPFLLLATRLNMLSDKRHASIDGTELFEKFSLEVALNFWGHPRVYGGEQTSADLGGLIFGTSREKWRVDASVKVDQSKFAAAISELCKALGEGVEFDPKDTKGAADHKDDRLDVVVWRRFNDDRVGKLIGFGQCKTGTNWPDHLTDLQCRTFCDSWMRVSPPVLPVRMFFITERAVEKWYNRCHKAGLLFDRGRLLEYSSKLPDILIKQCAKWTRAAMAAHGLKW